MVETNYEILFNQIVNYIEEAVKEGEQKGFHEYNNDPFFEGMYKAFKNMDDYIKYELNGGK